MSLVFWLVVAAGCHVQGGRRMGGGHRGGRGREVVWCADPARRHAASSREHHSSTLFSTSASAPQAHRVRVRIRVTVTVTVHCSRPLPPSRSCISSYVCGIVLYPSGYLAMSCAATLLMYPALACVFAGTKKSAVVHERTSCRSGRAIQ